MKKFEIIDTTISVSDKHLIPEQFKKYDDFSESIFNIKKEQINKKLFCHN